MFRACDQAVASSCSGAASHLAGVAGAAGRQAPSYLGARQAYF